MTGQIPGIVRLPANESPPAPQTTIEEGAPAASLMPAAPPPTPSASDAVGASSPVAVDWVQGNTGIPVPMVNYVQRSLADGLVPTGPDPDIVPVDKALELIFDAAGVPRLGGASGDLGWSSFSTFQRCPYLYYRTYIHPLVPKDEQIKSAAFEIGSTVHTFLALRYIRLMDPAYPLTPESAMRALYDARVNAEVVSTSWRLYEGYSIKYEADYLRPLSVEFHTVDPATRQSCRYDLIAEVTEAQPGIMPGTWIVEHKTASKFDEPTLHAWRNDGEIIGQLMLWKRLKLDKKFGKLQGVLVNIIGKQKNQLFARTPVPVLLWKHKEHAADLKVWQGIRGLCQATDTWPRARANCVGRYQCRLFDHCADRE
jgi:hypothetical protein